ncbi:sugar phosphate isomerase/epimerase family protein [Micrococcoides hystricis]|uniref:Sugar phosphate isomerase/epimerase family protein n=1 Tax=Micrococcoides hystricis TaxID=1572761 RepID=A0ABV6PCI8_9MICC
MTASPIGLAALTVLDKDPIEQVELAEKHGFDTIGVRLIPATPTTAAYRLHEEPAQLTRVLKRLADSPVTVFDVEIIRLNADYAKQDFRPFLETSQALGAKAVLVSGDDEDPSRLVDSYADFAQQCAAHGLAASLEPMSWTAVPNVQRAIQIVSQADGPGRSILIDTLHTGRSTTTLEDIRCIPAEWIHYAQVCDAPVPTPESMDEIIRQAREERLPAGEGGLDLVGMIAALPAGTPLSVELPNERRRQQLGDEQWLPQLLAATKAVEQAANTRRVA